MSAPVAPRGTTLAPGCLPLGSIAGIPVYLHWSWFAVACFELTGRGNVYSSPLWNVLEYLCLFGIVLLHELGHAFACRQVGGTVQKIILWPLGGVVHLSPPRRPGADLWSTAAGPLVNLLLVPVSLALIGFGAMADWPAVAPDVWRFVQALGFINFVQLVFNLLPINPLDGGRILRALLWYVMGHGPSQTVASFIGVLGALTLLAGALWWWEGWMIVLSLFLTWEAAVSFFRADGLGAPSRGERSRRRRESSSPGISDSASPEEPSCSDGQAPIPERSSSGAAACARAIEAVQTGQYDRALTLCNEAILFNPCLAAAYATRGEAHRLLGDFDRALGDLAMALRLEPHLAAARLSRGLLFIQCERYDLAAQDCDELIRNHPDLAPAYRCRAAAYRGLSEEERAEADDREALRLAPDLAGSALGWPMGL